MAQPYERSMPVRTYRAPASYSRNRNYTPRTAEKNGGVELNAVVKDAGHHSPGSYIETMSQDSRISGYSPDTRNSQYDASSVGSVTSYSSNQMLDVRRLPLDTYGQTRNSTDSGMYSSRRTQSVASSESSYVETDLDMVAKGGSKVGYGRYQQGNDRYDGELYRPRAAPRKTIEAKKLFGEIHPKLLAPEDIPATDSENDLDDQSSCASLSVTQPVPAPRASLRVKKGHFNPVFIEDELDNSKSGIPKGILKSSDGSASELARASGNKRLVVRFEQVKKETTNVRDLTDYNAIDSDGGGSKKGTGDIWGHVKPVSKKPARNDPKRSSGGKGRQSRSSNSTSGRRSRSSSVNSHDRSRSHRSSSHDRSSNRSNSKDRASQRSSSLNRQGSTQRSRTSSRDRTQSTDSTVARKDDVKIEIPSEAKQHQSMMSDIVKTTDSKKLCKWALIITIPLVLLIVVGAIIGVIVGSG